MPARRGWPSGRRGGWPIFCAPPCADRPSIASVFQGLDPAHARLDELPVVRKAELMHAFDDWVADPALRLDALRRFTADRSRIADPFAGRYVVWESSGSSGEPGIFVQDAHAMAVYDALEVLRRPAARSLERLMNPWRAGRAHRLRRRDGRAFREHGLDRAPAAPQPGPLDEPAQRLLLAVLRGAGGRARRPARPPSSPPIPAWRCCWPRSAWPAGCMRCRGRYGPAARRCRRRGAASCSRRWAAR